MTGFGSPFFGRYKRRVGRDPDAWHTVTAVFILRQTEWDLFKHLRPIMLLPITGKLYSRCLLSRLDPWIQPVSDFTFGFRKFFQASDLTMCLLRLKARREEWGEPWNLKTDLTKAYGRLWLRAVSRAMEKSEAPLPLRAAMMRWLLERGVVFEARGIGRTSPIFLGKGVPQGGPSSPSLSRLVLEDLFVELSRSWAERGMGMDLGHGSSTRTMCTCAPRCSTIFTACLRNSRLLWPNVASPSSRQNALG